jgi:TonB-dependent starch-binding outer membrane protein SusC
MKKVLLGFALSFLTLVSVLAQTKTITGRVTSAEEPQGVPGASVVVKGTTQGTITNLDGTYSISVPESANTLVFSFVGYLTKECEHWFQFCCECNNGSGC